MSIAPHFSIITPVNGASPEHLQQMVDSVRKQTFEDWQWHLVVNTTDDPEALRVLRVAQSMDPRLDLTLRDAKVGLVAASNDALAKAKGDWVVPLDQGDLLLPDSLKELRKAIAENPGAGYIYTDEDKVDGSGFLSDTFLKPDWSPERLRHQMYLGHLSALRHDLVKGVGGFREGFDGALDHDLALRITERGDVVVHIPKVLYHARTVESPAINNDSSEHVAIEAGAKAISEHLNRVGRDKDLVVTRSGADRTYKTQRHFDSSTKVSVVIPTRGTQAVIWGVQRVLVVETVRSLLEHTSHANLEVVVVYDAETPQAVMEEIRELCGEKLIEKLYEKPFNFSEKCNLGFLAASGDTVVFLNDDMEIESQEFIEELCAPLEELSVGATGAHLTFSDGRIQHAGIIMESISMFHAYLGYPQEDNGYFQELTFDHEVSGLTGACIAVRRSVFEEVGGFTLELPSNFNDVDFCNKVRSRGYRLLWLADVKARHFESLSRDNTVSAREHQFILNRWGTRTAEPFMPFESARQFASNPNLA